ncbi:MAG: hypothetical protein E7632_08695 [Ruminococcaceae bacterium]|nr:hypothetical protein [Oscillospiraceae bacterium]
MKPKHISALSVVLCLMIVFSAIVITRTEVNAASPYPLMYYNDRAWPRRDSRPMEIVYSTIYVPVTLFAQLNGVSVKINEGQNLFIINNNDEYWLTFNVKYDYAYTQDFTQMYWRSAYYHGENYVPVESVCSHLRLNYEEIVSPVTGEVAIRVSDGSQKKTLEQLVRENCAGFFPPETEPPVTLPPDTDTTPPVTLPPDTETTIPAPELGERTVYITVEDSPGKYTEEILQVLDDFGYPATFFVIGDNVIENAGLLSQIAAKGHAIGLHTMTHNTADLTDSDAILADIEAENALLSRVIKQKSRIWRAPEGSERLDSLTPEVKLALRHSGYAIWDYNVNVPPAFAHPVQPKPPSKASGTMRPSSSALWRMTPPQRSCASFWNSSKTITMCAMSAPSHPLITNTTASAEPAENRSGKGNRHARNCKQKTHPHRGG